ncbi:hypothetical protein OPV22_005071 [Ensete ventricosum]|uniref:Phosphatidic acid phosphatase type 2/haloperoxidase domain-containing protein n=1 Tax=Ensete ventricosum TaxID=4639 RepID=A0AAV8RNA4_ENSVE|nr:hypothetical protein OPV22_005071 [Ensete ventricosum]
MSFSDTAYFVILNIHPIPTRSHGTHSSSSESLCVLRPCSFPCAVTGGSSWRRRWRLTLSSILGWVVASSWFDLTKRIRALAQPWVTRRVLADTPSILWLQSMRHGFLDCIFSVLSCFVSVPFYTGFLPIVYWSGHRKLARQMTLLMAFCELYKGNAMEYGLPSSHCLNTVCLLGYMLHHFLTHTTKIDAIVPVAFLGSVSLLIILIGMGRIDLGMHSLIDVVAGIIFGLVTLALWLMIHEYVDEFITSGQNVTSFWASLSFLLCFAYPTPEFPTPSFEYHTAFNGVAFGLVGGIHQHLHPQHGGSCSMLASLGSAVDFLPALFSHLNL